MKETIRAIDDGRSFWEHAADAGCDPARWRECVHLLDDLAGWIEPQSSRAACRTRGTGIGVVDAISGVHWTDVTVHGRGDHAGATPMDFRLDPTTVAAESILELERLRARPVRARSARSARST